MKKWFLAILVIVFGLAGCGQTFNQKHQLKQANTTVMTSIRTEDKALTTIDNATSAFPSTFQAAYQQNASQDFENNGAVANLIQRRNTAYKQLESAQSDLESANTSMTKLANQKNATLPADTLKDTLNSLKLAKLDHKTFDAYYSEMVNAETDFFKTVKADPTNKQAVDTALSRMNEYGSALSQQAEIVVANLKTASTQADTLKKALNKTN